jgi:hypothetical protein
MGHHDESFTGTKLLISRKGAIITYVLPTVKFHHTRPTAVVSSISASADIKLIMDSTSAGLVYVDTRIRDAVIPIEVLTINISVFIENGVSPSDLTPRHFSGLFNESIFAESELLVPGETPELDQVTVTIV